MQYFPSPRQNTPPNISPPPEYKPPNKYLRNLISPGLIFGGLRYIVSCYVIAFVVLSSVYSVILCVSTIVKHWCFSLYIYQQSARIKKIKLTDPSVNDYYFPYAQFNNLCETIFFLLIRNIQKKVSDHSELNGNNTFQRILIFIMRLIFYFFPHSRWMHIKSL